MASNRDDGFNGKSKLTEEKKSTGSKRHKTSDSKPRPHSKNTSYNIHISNIENLQIGNHNRIDVHQNNRPHTRSQDRQQCTVRELTEVKLTPKQQSKLTELQGCKDEVNIDLMLDLSKSWGSGWRMYGRMLDLDDPCLDNIGDQDKDDAGRERSYKVLHAWKKKTNNPTVSNLITLLTSTNYDAVMSLLNSDNEQTKETA